MPKRRKDDSHAGTLASARSDLESSWIEMPLTAKGRQSFGHNFAHALWKLGRVDASEKTRLLGQLVDNLKAYYGTYCNDSCWKHEPGTSISEDLLTKYWKRLQDKAKELKLDMPVILPEITYRTAKPDATRDVARKRLVNKICKSLRSLKDGKNDVARRIRVAEVLEGQLNDFEKSYCKETEPNSSDYKILHKWRQELAEYRPSSSNVPSIERGQSRTMSPGPSTSARASGSEAAQGLVPAEDARCSRTSLTSSPNELPGAQLDPSYTTQGNTGWASVPALNDPVDTQSISLILIS